MRSCQVRKRTSEKGQKKWFAICALHICFVLFAIGFFGWKLAQIVGGPNLHEVLPGQIYRSAQLSPATLEQAVAKYGIRTVINLRGCCPCTDWYQHESESTFRLDLNHEDINFSAERIPSNTEIRRLIEVLDRTEYPVLIHCRRGADRTGLAAAVALLLRNGMDLAAARGQLSIRYGHITLGRTARMGEFIGYYEQWLQTHSIAHSPEAFRRWALQEYQRTGPYRAVFEKHELLVESGKVDTSYQVKWGIAHHHITAGEPFSVRVRVRNSGSETWHFRPTEFAGVHLVYHMLNADSLEIARGRAGCFETQIVPGESIDLLVPVVPIKQPGKYFLLLDMADEQIGEFYQMGSEPVELRLDVR